MTGDVREQLAANAKQRAELAAQTLAAEQEEHALIAAAWREGVPPGEIAALAGRSGAHIRKLRPDDIPPARRGGGAYVPKRKPRGRTK